MTIFISQVKKTHTCNRIFTLLIFKIFHLVFLASKLVLSRNFNFLKKIFWSLIFSTKFQSVWFHLNSEVKFINFCLNRTISTIKFNFDVWKWNPTFTLKIWTRKFSLYVKILNFRLFDKLHSNPIFRLWKRLF